VDGDFEQVRNERERRLFEVGGLLLAHAAQERTWSERWFEKLAVDLLADADLKVRVLRFIDVLPTLDDAGEVVRHLREYFLEDEAPITAPIKRLIGLAEKGPAALAHGVRLGLARVAGRYIVSADRAKMLAVVQSLRNTGRGFSLDLLGEAVLSDAEADDYLRSYLKLIESLPGRLQDWPAARLDDVDGRPGPRLYLSIKLSSLYPWIDTLDPEGSIAGIAERLRPLLLAARRQRVFVCFDMEQYDFKEIVLATFKTLLMEPGLRDWAEVGIALQAYLRETENDLAELIAWADRRACPVTVRLVRGAYWDYETVIAQQAGWPSPVWGRKEETDLCYERCLQQLFDAYPVVRVAVASHNPRSLALAMVLAERGRLQSGDFEFQMLYGMAEPLQRAIVALGHRLRVYLPCGDALPGMAYLVRRLLENSSSQSLERMSLVVRLDTPERLLAAPVVPVRDDGSVAPVPEGLAPFRNEPVHRFTDPGERERFAEAVARAGSQSHAVYPLVIDGQPVDTGDYMHSVNPARPHEIVGRVAIAGQPEADRAIAGAAEAFRSWSRLPATTRVAVMRKAAALLRERRDEFAALEILEAGKTWREADANVTEAIDYLEFYARQALRLAAPESRDVAGETNRLGYRPLGVGLILPPWNFPLAILVGMLSAAVVAGNTVLLKPSSLTPVIAARFVGLLQEAGVPPGVVQFVPGPGNAVGEYLVQHSGIHFIAFTGSREVGLGIWEEAGKTKPGQLNLKKVVCEMGGKNAMIIDNDADLDEAIPAALYSAFGFAGQKCSALSRIYVDRAVAELRRGAVVAIGNAPTALFRLLEMLDEGAPKPAMVIGMPVGFVGAAESKEALLADGRVPCVIVRGRKGGSAMTAAAVNALASDRE